MENLDDDYDNPWKDAVEHEFPAFLEFFFPEVHAQIDWDAGHTFLEQELRAITRQSERGRKRTVDLLVQVRRLDGTDTWVYVHIEIQTQPDADLPQRVFVYHYRLFDRYEAPIASLVVLADPRRQWRPAEYSHDLFGCRLRLEFPVAKLADHADRLDELLEDTNPFAVVTAAHLLTQRTKGDHEARYLAKRRLTRLLYERGWNKPRVLDLFFIIDALLQVPDYLNQRLWQEITTWEEEDYDMRYISSIERIGEARGKAIGEAHGKAIGEAHGKAIGKAIGEATLLERLLVRRFGPLPETTLERLKQADSGQLEAWFDRAMDATDLTTVFNG